MLAQRAVLKFARYIGCSSIAGRFTPGAFTNQIQAAFREPRLLLISDPRSDHQPVTEASYANIPIVAFTNVDSPTKFIDIAVPCNNKSPQSIGLMWWFPAKEEWGGEELAGGAAPVTDWSADGAPASAAVPAAVPAAAQPAFQVTDDWAAQTETSDWAAQSAPAGEAAAPNTWGGSSQWS